MYKVEYAHELSYIDEGDRPFPGLWLTLSSLHRTLAVQALATLDSGAEVSLFDGTLAMVLGIDVMAGERRSFMSTTGAAVKAYVHPVSLHLSDIGELILPVAFSTGPLLRNLLGRDFFFAFKVGFQERSGVLHLGAEGG